MFKLLRRMRRRDRRLTLLCVMLVAAQVYLDLRLPDCTKEITLLVSMEVTDLAQYMASGVRMLGLAAASALLAVVVGFYSSVIAGDFARDLRSDISHKVMDFGADEVGRLSTASLITRATNDVSQVRMLIAIGLQMLVKAPVMAVWAVAKIVNTSWQLSCLVAFAVLVILVVVGILMSVVIPKFRIVQTQVDDVNRVARENLSGLRVVRAFNAEGYQEDKFEGVSKDLMDTQLFTMRAMALMNPVMGLAQSLLALAIYWFGAYLINDIKVPLSGPLAASMAAIDERASLLGDVVVFNSYALYVIMSFLMLLAIFVLLPRAQVSAGRINEVLDTEIAVTEGTVSVVSGTGTVEFRDVTFRYPEAADDCLEHISFTAGRGETVAFIGATGSGKSTLVGLAARLHDVTDGSVWVDGVDVRDLTFEALYDRVAYVPQRPQLFQGTIEDNVRFGNLADRISDEDVDWALDIAQASEFVDGLEEGKRSAVGQGGSNFSGGQRQRLSIARGVARRPEVLILDDALSALDYKTDAELRRRLATDLTGTTCLIVAQRIGTIRNADRIVVLDGGRVAGMGTHEELMRDCAVYQEIAASQFSADELSDTGKEA